MLLHALQGLYYMTSQSRRSLVYIVADDWRNEAAAAYGQRHMQTPNIDALSRSGLTFDRAYCQLARCAPSRHSFLTGRGPQTTRVLTSSSYFRGYNPTSNEWRTLPEHLRLNGWLTFGMGKLFPSNSYHDEPRSWSPDMAYFGYDMQRCPGIIDPRKLPQIESPTGTWCALEGSDAQFIDHNISSHAIAAIDYVVALRRRQQHSARRSPPPSPLSAPSTEALVCEPWCNAWTMDQLALCGGCFRPQPPPPAPPPAAPAPFAIMVGFVRPHGPWMVPARAWRAYRASDVPLPTKRGSAYPRGAPLVAAHSSSM